MEKYILITLIHALILATCNTDTLCYKPVCMFKMSEFCFIFSHIKPLHTFAFFSCVCF